MQKEIGISVHGVSREEATKIIAEVLSKVGGIWEQTETPSEQNGWISKYKLAVSEDAMLPDFSERVEMLLTQRPFKTSREQALGFTKLQEALMWFREDERLKLALSEAGR